MNKKLSLYLLLLFIATFLATVITSRLWMQAVLFVPEEENTLLLTILSGIGFVFSSLVEALIALTFVTIFLNLIPKIRNNYILSLATFVLVPVVLLTYYLASEYINMGAMSRTSFNFILALTLPYIVFATISFFFFRRKLKTINNFD